MSDLQKQYEEWLAKTSDKNYKDRNVTAAMAANYQSDEFRASQSIRLKAIAKDPEWKRKHDENAKKLAKDPEWLRKNREIRLKLAKDPEWLRKNIETHRHLAKPVTTPNGEFESIAAYKREVNRVFYYLKKGLPHLYYFTEEGPSEAITEKTFYTIYGSCAKAGGDPGSMAIMFQVAKDAGCEHANNMKSHSRWFQKMCKLDPENFYTQVEPKRDWHLKLNGEVK